MIFDQTRNEEIFATLKRQSRKRRIFGFTLLELVVVIALISVLVMSIIPSVNAISDDQKKFMTKSTLKLIGDSIKAYYTVSHVNPSLQIIPLEYYNDPLDKLVKMNLLNKTPKDAWKNDIHVFISSSVLGTFTSTGTIEVADGATSNFNFKLYTPTSKSIIPSTFTGYYIDTVGTATNVVTQEITDNGSGVLSGAGSGTIAYDSGEVAITFNVAPGNGEPVEASYRMNIYGGSFAYTGISAGPDKKFGTGDDITYSIKKTTF